MGNILMKRKDVWIVGAYLLFGGALIGFVGGAAVYGEPRPAIEYCPVPPESEVVCGYVHDDNPNHAGLYLRGTGCSEYDGGEG